MINLFFNIKKNKSLKRSISIVELTIALAVVGIMTGVSIHYGVKYHKQSVQNADTEKIEVIQKALKNYFKQNRRLPKPTDYTISRNSEYYGKEKNTTTGDISFDSDIYTSLKKQKILVLNKNRKVPEEYRQVEYIQSNGTQYIDTGVYPSEKDKNEIEIEFTIIHTTYNNNYPVIFGTRAGNHTVDQMLIMRETDRSFFRVECGSYHDGARTIPYTSGEKYIVKWSNNYVQFNNNIYKIDCSTKTTSTYPLALFTLNDGGNYKTFNSHTGTKKIYYAKIKMNNTLVRDFVPVYRKSDNVAGLYDTVNNVFYNINQQLERLKKY